MFETQYYTVKMPEAWVGKCVDYIEDFEDGTSIVTFYEKECYMTSYSGKICSIQLMPSEDDTYKDFPDYEWLGALDTPEGSFNMILLYPTDVQLTVETMDTYNQMARKLPDVLCTISPKEGIEMVMPAPVFP